jgi:hypothetical protein
MMMFLKQPVLEVLSASNSAWQRIHSNWSTQNVDNVPADVVLESKLV